MFKNLITRIGNRLDLAYEVSDVYGWRSTVFGRYTGNSDLERGEKRKHRKHYVHNARFINR